MSVKILSTANVCGVCFHKQVFWKGWDNATADSPSVLGGVN